MVAGRVSILVPSRNERYLPETVRDLLSKAEGDIELIVVLDGYWPDPPLPADPRLKILHRGSPLGMRPAINAAAQMATGEHLMKVDAHVLMDQGFDRKLVEDYHEDNWVVVPRRYALDPDKWAIDHSNRKYPIDYHFLSYPFERPEDPTCGMHGTEWRARREARKDVLIDDEMSSQGSCWFMSRKHFDRIGPLDVESYGSFIQEMQEIGLRTWLGGGALKVNKKTFYAHLYKSRRFGRGYSLQGSNHQAGACFCIDYWMNDQWFDRVHSLRWLVEKFWPVPTWPVAPDGSLDVSLAFRPRAGIAAQRFSNSTPDGKAAA